MFRWWSDEQAGTVITPHGTTQVVTRGLLRYESQGKLKGIVPSVDKFGVRGVRCTSQDGEPCGMGEVYPVFVNVGKRREDENIYSKFDSPALYLRVTELNWIP
ncbi:hypothetical protein Tco_0149457 [Tanacetum coccineum]